MSDEKRRGGVLFIIITIALDAMGIGLIVPVMPDLIQSLQGRAVGDAALWGGILMATFSAMQFLFGPLLGALSDRFGRRPVLLVSLAAMAVDYLIMALANALWLLVLTRIIGGITAATHSTASAYIADISPPEKKSANFGLVGAAFGVGFVLGPVVGGVLSDFGTRAPFYAAMGLALLNFLYGLFVLPETVTDQNRRAFDWRRADPWSALKAVRHLPRVSRLLGVVFLYEFAFMIYPSIWTYFAIERYGWGPKTVGASLMLVGVSMALVQGGLIRVALRYIREDRLILWGLLFEVATFGLICFVTQGWLALTLIPVSALGAVVLPTLQGIMSRQVPDNQQGELQGVISSARALAAIFAPMIFAGLFQHFSTGPGLYLPAAPFILSMVLMVMAAALFVKKAQPV